ncbi:helix-turn-helix transcriptional regulator [uncultured Phocaeicola sp.]|jgi:transcriptional regulator with XRE-family HTH domain|uniref:helix-turn-helix transcriptional regulator n=1 Tax=uncultured Phocaeicola sp. TaxID=990718 RepID=UPI00258BF278|nr:helix-turn-helix transcriptional regulator [uncultured Phocaeicola sp.]
MDIDVKPVHIGQAIDKRRLELGLSKSEFGRKIGVPQQHVNRILERETMETTKLIKVCQALDFNFFALFCSMSHQISAYLAAVTLNGNAHNTIGDNELAAQLSKEQAVVESQKETIRLLKEQLDNLNTQINRLDSNLKDKDEIIRLLKERNS